MVLAQGSGQGSDKWPRHSGGFSGASGGHVPQMHYSDQLPYSAPPAPISAPPLQSFQGGYSGRHDQFHGQQSQQPMSCYTCGDPRHISRFFPRTSGSSQHQSSRALVPVPVAAMPAQPARGRGQAARGRGQTVRGVGQAVRGGDQPARGHPRDVVQGGGAQPWCYVFLARPEAESCDTIITGSVSVFSRDASVLFDLESTYSYGGKVIVYASRHLKVHEKNYHVHDLELTTIVHVLKI
ncbi:uncharacterized protein [Nicotiana tomentosiformis]|uniref:uncharacterized protein n=1 Tax=Nicotiana tomentosiformis TaxID=4098 RepID=UPI00388C7EB4